MSATERFAEVVRRPDHDVPLDEGAFLIAAHAHPELDVDVALGQLDHLADAFTGATAAELATYLFVERGFAGNSDDYDDPRNSYLDDVIARRLGIPITLSVLMMEVGRRAGIPVLGVGMPGHFLVREAGLPNQEERWFDPFHGGRELDEAGCRAIFEGLHGGARSLGPEDLAPVSAAAILARMLANLQRTLLRRAPRDARWALQLRLLIPTVPVAERLQAATMLGSLGAFVEAADVLDDVAEQATGEDQSQVAQRARALRARAN